VDAENAKVSNLAKRARASGARETTWSERGLPRRRPMILDDRIETYLGCGQLKVLAAGRALKGHNEQASLLAVGTRLGHQSYESSVLVLNRRAREASPKAGVVGDTRVDI
jgi:hypothetical protein